MNQLVNQQWMKDYPWVEPDQALIKSLHKVQPINTGINGRYYKPPYG